MSDERSKFTDDVIARAAAAFDADQEKFLKRVEGVVEKLGVIVTGAAEIFARSLESMHRKKVMMCALEAAQRNMERTIGPDSVEDQDSVASTVTTYVLAVTNTLAPDSRAST